MSVPLAVVAEEAVEALVDRITFGSRVSKAPFPKCAGGVASLFKGLSHCEGIGGYGELPNGLDFPVSPAWRMPGMETGHDDAASWCAYR